MSRLYPSRPIVGVGAVIVKERKILLEKRRSEPGAGKWTVPGGLIELGENIEQTVVREVKEETSLEVDRPQLIDVVDAVTHDGSGKVKYHFVIVDFLVRLRGGELKADDDAAELRWVDFDEVEGYNLTDSFREFFRRNRASLEQL